MLPEKLGGAVRGEFGGRAIMHRLALFVDEGVLGVITKKLERLAGGLHGLLEGTDELRRAPIVLVREMGLPRNLDVCGLCRPLPPNTIKHHAPAPFATFRGAATGAPAPPARPRP